MRHTRRLFEASLRGDASATAALTGILYERLKGVASELMAKERGGHTLQPTALVHEAFVRLAPLNAFSWRGKTHFCALASTTMRRILVDHARRKNAQKRGADVVTLPLQEDLVSFWEDPSSLLDLDQALEGLFAHHGRQARVAELRIFGGLHFWEIAKELGIHTDTAKRDWSTAREWLNSRLRSYVDAGGAARG